MKLRVYRNIRALRIDERNKELKEKRRKAKEDK